MTKICVCKFFEFNYHQTKLMNMFSFVMIEKEREEKYELKGRR